MKQNQASRADSRHEQSPEHQVDLTLIENELHLPSGGIFLPNSFHDYEDKSMPTREFEGIGRIGGAAVKLTLEIPKDILDPYPLLILPGYCGSEKDYEGLRKVVARNGKIAATYGAPRTQKNFASFHPKYLGNPNRLLAQAPWAVMKEIKKMRKKKTGIDLSEVLFDLAPHSMAGQPAIDVGLRHRKHVRSILFDEPAGLEPHTTPRMIMRLPEFRQKELKEVNDPSVILRGITYALRNPLRFAMEGIAVSNSEISEGVRELDRLGVPTAATFGLSDSLISARNSLIHSRGLPMIRALYRDKRAHHLWAITNPFEVAMTHQQLLDKMHETEESNSLQQAA